MRSPSTFLIAAAGLVLGALLIAVMPRTALFAVSGEHQPTAESSAGERWACPMMDFIGNRPGPCPVCGMAMTKVTAGELTLEQQRRMDVQLSTVVEGPARAMIRAYGTVRYDDRTLQLVIPRVSGRVVKRHDASRHSGAFVSVGDPIVDLYSPEAFAAQGELAAAVKLGDEPVTRAIKQRFERWNLATVARAILEGAEPADTVTITSPFKGRVVLAPEADEDSIAPRLPQVGQEVVADAPLLRLVDPDSYMLVIQVPEVRAHWLREGLPVQLASDDKGELPEINARITWVAPELNPEIRAREIHVHLHDNRQLLLPGSLVNARIEAALSSDLNAADPTKPDTWGKFTLVPKTAVLSTGVRHVAWRMAGRQSDGRARFELAPLALGPRIESESGNDLYVVRAGLHPGDQVATQGVFLIDSQAQLAGTPSLLFPTGAISSEAPQSHQH